MKHQIDKVKFRGGKDANSMLMRKLCVNFFSHGHLRTTEAKAKKMKQFLDRIVGKMINPTEADRKIVFAFLQNKTMMNELISQVSTDLKDIKGGYIRLKRDTIRSNDGSQMMNVEWARPMVKQEEPKVEKASKKVAKPLKEAKETEKKVTKKDK